MRTRFLCAAVVASAACSSIEGRYIGAPEHGDDVGGLPIVVERTRWLKVTYKDVTYVLLAQKAAGAEGAPMEVLKEIEVREVSVEPVKSEELYAIDLMRPAAGKIDYDLEFAEGKAYPKRIKGTVEDKTIETVAGALDDLLARIDGAGEKLDSMIPEGVSTVKLGETVAKIEFYDVVALLRGETPQPLLTLQ
jgi:hypothetical protein